MFHKVVIPSSDWTLDAAETESIRKAILADPRMQLNHADRFAFSGKFSPESLYIVQGQRPKAMRQNRQRTRTDEPLSHSLVPRRVFDRFRNPGAPIRMLLEPGEKPGASRCHIAPAARLRGLYLVLKENFTGNRLIDATLFATPEPPAREECFKSDGEWKKHALLRIIIQGHPDLSLWVRGRGCWVRYRVCQIYGARHHPLGAIPVKWRKLLHEMELFADGLARANAGSHQGFWQKEFDPRESYRKKPEKG